MSSSTAFILALTALLSVVADLVSEKGPLYRISAAARSWWRIRHPLPVTPEQEKAAADLVVDGRIVSLQQHVEILQQLVDTSQDAAAAATAAAAAARESADAARESAEAATVQLDRVAHELDRWHRWATTWWPTLRSDAARLGVPDPPPMTDRTPQEDTP